VWREEPHLFELDGRRPVADAFAKATAAWQELLAAPGSAHLVITHKSMMRAMLCTALGMPTSQFRAIDISNGAVCIVRWVSAALAAGGCLLVNAASPLPAVTAAASALQWRVAGRVLRCHAQPAR
jgi:broad specificity phosphatase PhoE